MNKTLLKRYLALKLRQVSTVGGIGVALVMLARVFGFEIPSEMVGPIENLALAAIAIALFFLKESGEDVAVKEMTHDANVADRAVKAASVMAEKLSDHGGQV
jgi:hypothetical protein